MRILLSILLVMLVHFAQQKERIDWAKIVPFETTRDQIEAKFGKPTFGSDYVLSYDTKDDRITVWYGGVKRRENSPCNWVLPKDTVLSFVYAPKKKFPLSELPVDLTRFQKHKAFEMENDYYYHNPTDGLTLTTRMVDGEEMFLSLERDPDQAQRQKNCTMN